MSTRKEKRASGLYGIELPDLELMRLKEAARRAKEDAKIRCAIDGHDYQNVIGITGKICVCCGQRPEQK